MRSSARAARCCSSGMATKPKPCIQVPTVLAAAGSPSVCTPRPASRPYAPGAPPLVDEPRSLMFVADCMGQAPSRYAARPRTACRCRTDRQRRSLSLPGRACCTARRWGRHARARARRAPCGRQGAGRAAAGGRRAHLDGAHEHARVALAARAVPRGDQRHLGQLRAEHAQHRGGHRLALRRRPASQRRRAASAGPTLVTQPPHAPPRFPMPPRDRPVVKTQRVDGKPPARCCWGALRLARQRRQRTGTWRGSALTVNRPLSTGCARRHRRCCASTLQDPLRPARRAAQALSWQRAPAW